MAPERLFTVGRYSRCTGPASDELRSSVRGVIHTAGAADNRPSDRRVGDPGRCLRGVRHECLAYSSRGFPRSLVPVLLPCPSLQVLILWQWHSGLGLLALTITSLPSCRERWVLVAAEPGDRLFAGTERTARRDGDRSHPVGKTEGDPAKRGAVAAIDLLPLIGLAFTLDRR